MRRGDLDKRQAANLMDPFQGSAFRWRRGPTDGPTPSLRLNANDLKYESDQLRSLPNPDIAEPNQASKRANSQRYFTVDCHAHEG